MSCRLSMRLASFIFSLSWSSLSAMQIREHCLLTGVHNAIRGKKLFRRFEENSICTFHVRGNLLWVCPFLFLIVHRASTARHYISPLILAVCACVCACACLCLCVWCACVSQVMELKWWWCRIKTWNRIFIWSSVAFHLLFENIEA